MAAMKFKRAGSQPWARGAIEWFTGTVWIDLLNAPPALARHSYTSVTFGPGACTQGYTHPLGQTLIVAGPGRTVSGGWP